MRALVLILIGFFSGYLVFRKNLLMTIVGVDANEIAGSVERRVLGAVEAESTPQDVQAPVSGASEQCKTC